MLDLEVIILGGGMAKAGGDLLLKVKQRVKSRTWTVLPTDVRIVTASNASEAGTLGAALAAAHSITHLQKTRCAVASDSNSSWKLLHCCIEASATLLSLNSGTTPIAAASAFLGSVLLARKYICRRYKSYN